MSKLFGGKDPFDDPFFTQPFGSMFGGKNLFGDPFFHPFDSRSGPRKDITIEELNPDDDAHDSAPSKELVVGNPNPNHGANGSQSFCFQRVAYGGLNGMHYTSSVGRRTGGDGVVLVEIKEEDKTMGEALHTISRGVRDKGHSVTTKHNPDGRVDSMQTLHNLNEEELTGFEEAWKADADRNLPGWNNGFSLLENAGASIWDGLTNWGGWGLPSIEYVPSAGETSAEGESSAITPRGRAKKIVPVKIE